MIEGKITRHPDIGRLSAAGILYPTSCHFVVDCLSLQLVATKRKRLSQNTLRWPFLCLQKKSGKP